jgi:putative nucleotidyltransferase with HDIG domain
METVTNTLQPAEPVEPAWTPHNLPPFPAVALKALNVISGKDSSLRELCDLIRTDPVFSSEILRIANSPLVAFSKQITSVLQASMLLGFRRLRNVVITVGLRAYLNHSVTPALQSCWRHSVACAMIADRIAGWSATDKNFAYTAGVLHDIGRVALTTLLPQSYARVIERAADRPSDILQIERELCGIDHCEAGRSLVIAWKLPQDFVEIASHHHDPVTSANGATSVIKIGCALADALGFAVVQPSSPRSYAEILAEFPESVGKRLPGDPVELASAITKEIRFIESA